MVLLTTRFTATLAGLTLSAVAWLSPNAEAQRSDGHPESPVVSMGLSEPLDESEIADGTIARDLRSKLFAQSIRYSQHPNPDVFSEQWYLFIDQRPIRRAQDQQGSGWNRVVRSQNVPLDLSERMTGNRLINDASIDALQDYLNDLGPYRLVAQGEQLMDGLRQQEELEFPSNDPGLVAVRFTMVPRGDDSAPTRAFVLFLDRENVRPQPQQPDTEVELAPRVAGVNLTSGLPVGLELDAAGLTRRLSNRLEVTMVENPGQGRLPNPWRLWLQTRTPEDTGWSRAYRSDDIRIERGQTLSGDAIFGGPLIGTLNDFAGDQAWEIMGTSVLPSDGLSPEVELEWPGGPRVVALRFTFVPVGERTAPTDSLVIFVRPAQD